MAQDVLLYCTSIPSPMCGSIFVSSVLKCCRSDGALDRNTAQLSIGTAMHSGSEHRKTERAFSCPFKATSK